MRERVERYERSVVDPTPRQKHRCEQANAAGEARDLVIATDCLYVEDEVGPEPKVLLVDPLDADDATGRGQALIFLSRSVDDRMSRFPACWISSGANPAPDASMFVAPDPTNHLLAGKPATSALFTSWAGPEDDGMWRLFLEANKSISVVPQPWTSWFLTVRAETRILSINTALEWCQFVRNYLRPSATGDTVDWAAVAGDFDAVNFSLRAVFATDGIEFLHNGRTIAPVRWDTQTTTWLHWSFDQVSASKYPRVAY